MTTNPFPLVIESPADLWSGLDKLLEYVEAQGREPLNRHIGRMARLRLALFDAAPVPGVVDNVSPPPLRLADAPSDEEEPAPGKPEPAEQPDPAQAPQGAAPKREKGLTMKARGEQNRLTIATALRAAPGPLSLREIAQRTGLKYNVVVSTVSYHPWFAKASNSHGAPWQLTEASLTALQDTERPQNPPEVQQEPLQAQAA